MRLQSHQLSAWLINYIGDNKVNLINTTDARSVIVVGISLRKSDAFMTFRVVSRTEKVR